MWMLKMPPGRTSISVRDFDTEIAAAQNDYGEGNGRLDGHFLGGVGRLAARGKTITVPAERGNEAERRPDRMDYA